MWRSSRPLKNICSSVENSTQGMQERQLCCLPKSVEVFHEFISQDYSRIFKYQWNRYWVGFTQCETNWRHSNDASKLTMFYNDTLNTLPLITATLTILPRRRLDLPLVPKILHRAEGQGNSVSWLLSSCVLCIFQDFSSCSFYVTVVRAAWPCIVASFKIWT